MERDAAVAEGVGTIAELVGARLRDVAVGGAVVWPWDAGRGTVVGCVARPALWLGWWRRRGVYPVVEVREGPIFGLYLVGVMLRRMLRRRAKIRVWHTGVADSHFLTTSKSWIPVGTETRHHCLVFRVTSKVDNGCPNSSQFGRRVDNELAGNRDPMWRTIRTNHSPTFSRGKWLASWSLRK